MLVAQQKSGDHSFSAPFSYFSLGHPGNAQLILTLIFLLCWLDGIWTNNEPLGPNKSFYTVISPL